MNLRKKKELAAKTLNVGKARLVFVGPRKEEIKEAITKQDIRDLHKGGAILIKEIRGRKKNEKRRSARGPGKIRKKLNTRKRDYMLLTRKLRSYVSALKREGKLSSEEVTTLRKRIRNKQFRSKAHFKELLQVRT